MGEAVLRHIASERGVDINVDSAGTAGYHVGEEPDERSTAICRKHNVPIEHEARQVHAEDFRKFNHILAADESNLRNLMKIKPRDSIADVRLWGSYLDDRPIQDPYYGGIDGFEACYQQCTKLSHAFLDEVEGKPRASNL